MTNKTIIYRYLKSQGIAYADAYRMADELSKKLQGNPPKSAKPE